jgi:hypothetical protein
MITTTGQSLEILSDNTYRVKNLKWYATYTQDIKITITSNPAPVAQEK